MRIALLTDGIYPYVLGGMQKHSYYLAKFLAINGIYVDLYHTGSKDANILQLEVYSKEELAFIKSYYIPFPSVSKLPGHYVLESYLYSTRVYQQLEKNEPVDFIYAQGFVGWKTIIEKKNGSKLPVIAVNFHGVEMFQQAPNLNVKLQHLLLRSPVKYILRNADIICSLGGKLTSIQNRLSTKNIVEIPIGIEHHWLQESLSLKINNVRRFVFVGRYERRKGIEELHHVIKEISDNNSFSFTFIGPIPAEKQLELENVKYLGLIKEEHEIKKILQSCDVLVCPSYSEGMPTVILEAMASGLAVIATDVGAVSALVSAKNGWLISVADRQSLKQAIVDASNLNENEMNGKKKASLQVVKNSYTWEKVIKTTIEEIKNHC